MKRYRNKAFKFNQDLDKAYRRLFGPEPSGCTVCGENDPSALDIHKADDSNDFKVLCVRCRGKVVMNDCFESARCNATQDGATL